MTGEWKVPAKTVPKPAATTLAAALSLAGFVLLVNGLGDLRMWGDSSYSVMVARQDLATITLTRNIDGHPPLFYYLLHFWLLPAGQSELALRFLSIAPAALTPAVVYQLGVLLFRDRRIALLATLLTAISPLLIYQARLIRMYSLFTLLALLSLYALLAAIRDGGRHRWLAYCATALLALYTHYYALIFLLAGAVYFLAGWRAHANQARSWLASNVAAGLLFLPWLAYAAATAARTTAGIISNAPTPVGFLGYLGQTIWLSFNVGTEVDMRQALPIGLAVGGAILVLAATAWGSALKEGSAGVAVLGTILIVVIAVCSAIFQYIPYAVRPRFLMPAVPLYLLLVSWLVLRAATRRPATAIAGALVIAGGLLYALSLTYPVEGQLYEPEVVSLTRQLEGLVRPEDTVVFHGGWHIGYFSSHFRGPLPHMYDQARLSPAQAAEALKDSPRVWLATYELGTPAADSLPGWLDRHLAKANEQQIGLLRLHLYAQGPRDATGQPANLVFTMPDGTSLARVAEVGVFPSPAHPGDAVVVAVRWEVLAQPDRRYTAFVHLLDEAGVRVLGRDSEPVAGTRPTIAWRPGDVVEDRYALLLPESMPPGTYRLRLGLYATGDASVAPLPVRDASGGVVAAITVGEGDHSLPSTARVLDASFGGRLALAAVEMDADRFERWDGSRVLDATDGPVGLTFWRTAYQPGEQIRLTLYWRALTQLDQDYQLSLRLIAPDGRLAAEADGAPVQGRLPATRWAPGHIAIDEHELALPEGLAAGDYQLRLGLYQPSTGQPLSLEEPAGDSVSLRAIHIANP